MKTTKRLMLLEATFKKVKRYTGNMNAIVKLHNCTQVIHQLRKVGETK